MNKTAFFFYIMKFAQKPLYIAIDSEQSKKKKRNCFPLIVFLSLLSDFVVSMKYAYFSCINCFSLNLLSWRAQSIKPD